MTKKKLSYEMAIEELQEIVSALEEDSSSMDELSEKVERAAELIQWCRDKLRKTETDLGKLFE